APRGLDDLRRRAGALIAGDDPER
ncbi:MAG: hypothetical protein QOI73_2207, partial [Solirubrobacteraceae bacterium]|nr:hypothetical protein [Solirubrobacteraceae bacterium]